MSTIDQQFIEFIVKSLVNNPDDVSIERKIDEKGVLLTLSVADEDLGRVIGKRGSTAQSMRTLLRALGTKNDARYNLKIVDPNGDRRPPRDEESYDDGGAKTAPAEAQTAEPTDSEPAATTADEPVETAAAQEPTGTDEPKEQSDSLAEKTRKELAELDDLDI